MKTMSIRLTRWNDCGGFSPRIVTLVSILVIFGVVWSFTKYKSSTYQVTEADFKKEPVLAKPIKKMDWKNIDLRKDVIPDVIKQDVKSVEVKEDTVIIQGIPVFYRSAEGSPSTGQSVLLLHGMAFTSKTWVEHIDTLQHLAAMGHKVVAIDLPGFGNTKSSNVADKAGFLIEVMVKLKLDRPVVVSPSMSGGWALPLLKSHPEMLSGYVPVAPVGTGSVTKEEYQKLQVPTLIVYGELDTSLGHVSRDDLSNLPNSRVYELPGAKHPAYLDQTEMWHQLLYNFMVKLRSANV